MPTITRTAKFENGKLVYDPPLTQEEIIADRKRFNEMVAARQAPGTMGTDRAFLEGQHNYGFTDEPDFMQGMILTKAKEAGIQTYGKKYVGGLADHRGPKDPLAWVADTHEMKKVCEIRNLDCRGIVNHTAHEVEPAEDVALAENRIRQIDRDYAKQDRTWLKKSKRERREAIIDAHGAPARGKGARRAS